MTFDCVLVDKVGSFQDIVMCFRLTSAFSMDVIDDIVMCFRLTSAFTMDVIDDIVMCFRLTSAFTMDVIDDIVMCFRLTSAFTMDVIARTVFSLNINTQKDPNNAFSVKAQKIFQFSLLSPDILVICT